MPRLTKEELDAILDEHDEDKREARETARAQAEAARRERAELVAAQDDIIEDLTQALIDEFDSFDSLIDEEPQRRQPGRPVARHSAMREAFHANYGPTRDQLLRILRRMADEPINFPERLSTDPPPVNSLWVNRELPSLQVQVTRTIADVFSVRPIGEHRVDLPRVVQIPREVFYTWFRLAGSHLAEPPAETVFREAVQKISLKHGPAPEPGRSAWDRLLADDDEDETL
jgi:hypothetical protein